ncbi:ribose-5-phosphate isomerase RpiA [Poseidonocella sedimentorum]|uniref:Ribose-5-phosphate isomerase A n=1 Tax=Poseidonocella sedimentorum TaxID=871652 RepID=A0A1I6CXH2_9RHOB|nr:ribose-5-phosphate isomerase RpiA [Poseidonocella sedimentorum]SFQ97985.1 ribose-5-phosphate isomerase [Poseidonocella sedimentorum]
MSASNSPIDLAKLVAARRAVDFVESGMRVGLGTGSTAAHMVRELGRRVREEGLEIVGVPTSTATARLAEELGIPLTTLNEAGSLDVTIDGADEFDDTLTLIKGGGGALLQEKIVAAASERMIVIADAGKHVGTLGAFPLPVEVLEFGMQSTRRHIAALLDEADVSGREAVFRERDGARFVTDEGNHILDLHLGRIGDARRLATALNTVPGVVENGLFIDLCDTVIIGHSDGRVEIGDLASGAFTEEHGTGEEGENLFRDIAG